MSIFTMNVSTHELNFEDIQSLTDLLLACDLSKEIWDSISVDLSKQAGTSFDENPNPKIRIYKLVAKSLRFPGGIETLLSRVRFMTDRNLGWYELAKSAFSMLCRFHPDFKEQADRLVDLVESINPNRGVVERICVSQLLERPKNGPFTNAFDVILVLFQQPERTQAIEFIQALTDHAIRKEERDALQNWINDSARILGVQPAASRSPYLQTNVYLMIQIQPVASDRFKLYSWIQTAGETMPTPYDPERTFGSDQLAMEIEDMASWVLNHFATDFTVELFVKRSVFCQDVTKWNVKVGGISSKLVCEAPIVFRCLERLEARRTEIKEKTKGLSAAQAAMELWKQNLAQKQETGPQKEFVNLAAWREKSASLLEGGDKVAEELIQLVVDAEEDFENKLDLLTKAICIGLGFVPSLTGDERDALSVALNRGAPVIIWFRELPGGNCVNESAFKDLLWDKATKVKVAALRKHLWTLRKAAVLAGDSNDKNYYVTMLYDDYDRVPPQPMNQIPKIQ